MAVPLPHPNACHLPAALPVLPEARVAKGMRVLACGPVGSRDRNGQ